MVISVVYVPNFDNGLKLGVYFINLKSELHLHGITKSVILKGSASRHEEKGQNVYDTIRFLNLSVPGNSKKICYVRESLLVKGMEQGSM